MQKKFKYARLNRVSSWYFNGEIMESLVGYGLIEALNILGEEGWQVISVNDTHTSAILMKEYYIGE